MYTVHPDSATLARSSRAHYLYLKYDPVRGEAAFQFSFKKKILEPVVKVENQN